MQNLDVHVGEERVAYMVRGSLCEQFRQRTGFTAPENPIKKGAKAGPKVVLFHGSKPSPKARNRMVRDAIVSNA